LTDSTGLVRKVLRFVVSRGGAGEGDLERARCTRCLCREGTLLEFVHLKISTNPFTDEELDRFVEKLPIT
jgi:hypothetical protein